ncbi:MAG: hypothetical protein RLY14_1058, partial [Planctomycetota bacterium]
LSALGTVTINIEGANDNPVGIADAGTATEASGYANATAGSNATGNVLGNDTDVDSVANGETKTVTGVVAGVAGNAAGSVGSSVTGDFGAITINADGSFTYVVDESNTTVQALRLSSQTITDVFTYTVTDTGGLTSTTQVTITIQGANDAPVSSDDTTIAVEAGGLSNGTAGTSPSGNVLTNDSDVDSATNGETKTVTGVTAGAQASASGSVGSSVTGLYGAITIGADGSYTYTVDNGNATVQALRLSGQTLNDVFTYTMADTLGLTSTSTITVTIQGANDTPVTSDDTNTAVEAGGVANGTSGTNPTGNLLANDSDVDSVANGETKTVTGVVAGSQSSASGAVGSSVTGIYGSITIAADGSYSYTVDNSNPAVQALRLSGQTLSETFTYEMTDTGGLSALGTVTITIEGANDNPVGIADAGTATEASGYANATPGSNATGNVLGNDTDVDSVANGETKTVTGVVAGVAGNAAGSVGSSVTGDFGAITINADGSFTYVVDETNTTVQALRLSSQTITDVFTYTVTDTGGLTSTTQVTITIQGANDAPVSSDDTTIAVEAGGLTNGTVGTNPSGNVLTNDSDVDSATNGETKTVTGVTAGAQASASGSVGSNVTGLYGAIIIGADGSYTYAVDDNNAAVQALRLTGQTLNDVFTYTMADTLGLTSTSTITVTIQGANDTPVTSDDTNTAVEAGGVANGTSGTNPTGNVLANDSDVDSVANGETKTVTGVVAGSQSSASGSVGSSVTGIYGSITIAADGSYTYTVDNSNPAVQALRLTGQTLSETFTYEMTDTGGLSALGTVTINIQGANDAPVAFNDYNIAIEAGGTANGTAGFNPSGNVLGNDTDVDTNANGETKLVVGVAAGWQASASGSVDSSVVGNYGSITIASDGSYAYTVDNSNLDVQALHSAADTLNDIFTYTMQDTGGLTATATVTITIQGANDAPIAVDDSYSTAENSSISMNARLNDYELDSGDPFTITFVSIVSGLGNVQIVNGEILYIPGADYDYLSVGETALVTITYEIQDAAGLSDTATVSLTIQGVRDALHVVSNDAYAVEDVPFAFPIAITQIDINGEQCSDVIIRGLPANSKMMDAAGQQRLVAASGLVSVFGMDLSTLSIELPRHYSGQIAVAIDVASNLGNFATQTFHHIINVEAIADMAQLNVTGGRLQIGGTISLPVNFQLQDNDGSEVPTMGVRGLPLGIAITDGTRTIVSDDPDRWYDISDWRFDKIRLDSAGGVPGKFILSYRLTTTEIANNNMASVEATAEIQIDAVLPQQSIASSKTDPSLTATFKSDSSDDPADESSKADLESVAPSSFSLALGDTLEADESSINVLPQETASTLTDEQIDRSTPADILRKLPADASFTHLEAMLGNTQAIDISADSMTQPVYRFRETVPEVFVKEEYKPLDLSEKNALSSQLREEAMQTRAFSIQSSLIMMWHLIRSSILQSEGQSDSDSRSEARPSLRVSRRDEEQ